MSLFDTLLIEFCPPLDSSLIAAFLAEIQVNDHGDTIEPSVEKLEELRLTLRELAAQAEFTVHDTTEALHPPSTEESSSIASFLSPDASDATTMTSTTDPTIGSSFHFLKAVLPHTPDLTITRALLEADRGLEGEPDMWEIMAGILSSEAVRELEERGLDESNEEPGEDDWSPISKRRPKLQKSTKKKLWGKAVPLVDIRQQQHKPSTASQSKTPASSDPWVQLTSISTHVASLVPSHKPPFFQSYFHSPTYNSPYDALCAALAAISGSSPPTSSDEYTSILISVLDILMPSYEDLDSEQRSRFVSDTELCINATQGKGEETLDLVKVLRDLDDDASGLGVRHSAPNLSKPEPVGTKSPAPRLPSGPPPIPPPPDQTVQKRNKSTTSSISHASSQWKKVDRTNGNSNTYRPVTMHVPTYTTDVNGMKTKRHAGAAGRGGNYALAEYQRRINDSMRRRNQMLQEASKMWQRGNSKSRGGEVAMFFAERARQYQEMARKDALDAARLLVESKRLSSSDPNSIDLHGTNVSEAVTIVREKLHELGCAQSNKPLKIITGRGTHSVNHVSVLKPALRKALAEDGWSVTSWDAGLTVRGRHQFVVSSHLLRPLWSASIRQNLLTFASDNAPLTQPEQQCITGDLSSLHGPHTPPLWTVHPSRTSIYTAYFISE